MGRGDPHLLLQASSPVDSESSSSRVGEQEGETGEAKVILCVWQYVDGGRISLDLFASGKEPFKAGRSPSSTPSFHNQED